jgi:hypothetical protein
MDRVRRTLKVVRPALQQTSMEQAKPALNQAEHAIERGRAPSQPRRLAIVRQLLESWLRLNLKVSIPG